LLCDIMSQFMSQVSVFLCHVITIISPFVPAGMYLREPY